MEIIFAPEIQQAAPQTIIGVIRASVVNGLVDDRLKELIDSETRRIASDYELLEINRREPIAATRSLYKVLGKDPNRYRVSAEALCRRIIRGLGLYTIDTLVDIGNLLSIKSGYAVGVFDEDKIIGPSLTLRPGTPNDIYNAIGRGPMNIAGLPVYFDSIGGIGSPTSDEERTKISPATTSVHININAFDGNETLLNNTMQQAVELLTEFAHATDFSLTFHRPQ